MIWLASTGGVGDVDGERTVVAIIALLTVLGIALVMLAVWMWRVTRPDPELLAPLELMGERSWRRRDPVSQRRKLDEVRPTDADPLTRPNAPPVLDEAFHAGPQPMGVTDLSQYAVGQPRVAEDGPEVEQAGAAVEEIDDVKPVDDPPVGTPTGSSRPPADDLVDPAGGTAGTDGPAEATAQVGEDVDGGARPT